GRLWFAGSWEVAGLPARFFPADATRVLTHDGRQVVPGSGQAGVLAFSGPIPLGYYKDTAKTTATFRTIGGVRYTIPGDLAQVEADGAIRFLGRGSGGSNTGGGAGPPGAGEDALLAHPDVTDAAVVGVSDETWGERVVAVVATANRSLTDTELQALVRRRLAGYKVPRRIVLVSKLPRTPAGKLEFSRVKSIAESASGGMHGNQVRNSRPRSARGPGRRAHGLVRDGPVPH